MAGCAAAGHCYTYPMKTIYLVRHGESEGNVGPIRQSDDSPLTERGREQARFIAGRIAKLAPDVLMSSTFVRAKETAAIIAEHYPISLEESELFGERRRPSIQLNRPKDDAEALAAEQAMIRHFTKEGYRHSDEENFDDLKQRGLEALTFLQNRPEQSIAAVTHGLFMRILLACAVFGESLTAPDCNHFIRAFQMENTGLTVLSCDDQGRWYVRTWNDHAHLA